MSKFTFNKNDRYGVYNPQNTRITRENLMTLRAAAQREDRPHKTVIYILNELAELFSGLVTVREHRKAHTMCKYYGHVIRGRWHSYYPTCDDCGAVIKNSKEMRRAVPN